VVIIHNDEEQSTGIELDKKCYYAQRQVELGAQVYATVTSTMVWEAEIQKHLTGKRCSNKSECESDSDRCIDMIIDELICSLIDSMQKTYPSAPSLKPILISAFGHIPGKLPYWL
jgi:hypothetical protein